MGFETIALGVLALVFIICLGFVLIDNKNFLYWEKYYSKIENEDRRFAHNTALYEVARLIENRIHVLEDREKNAKNNGAAGKAHDEIKVLNKVLKHLPYMKSK